MLILWNWYVKETSVNNISKTLVSQNKDDRMVSVNQSYSKFDENLSAKLEYKSDAVNQTTKLEVCIVISFYFLFFAVLMIL